MPQKKNVEYRLDLSSDEHISDKSVAWAVGRSASWLAKDLDAKAIVAYTNSGFTARAVARFRPDTPILGVTPNVCTYRKMNISWGGSHLFYVMILRMPKRCSPVRQKWLLHKDTPKKGTKLSSHRGYLLVNKAQPT